MFKRENHYSNLEKASTEELFKIVSDYESLCSRLKGFDHIIFAIEDSLKYFFGFVSEKRKYSVAKQIIRGRENRSYLEID